MKENERYLEYFQIPLIFCCRTPYGSYPMSVVFILSYWKLPLGGLFFLEIRCGSRTHFYGAVRWTAARREGPRRHQSVIDSRIRQTTQSVVLFETPGRSRARQNRPLKIAACLLYLWGNETFQHPSFILSFTTLASLAMNSPLVGLPFSALTVLPK